MHDFGLFRCFFAVLTVSQPGGQSRAVEDDRWLKPWQRARRRAGETLAVRKACLTHVSFNDCAETGFILLVGSRRLFVSLILTDLKEMV